MTRMLVVAAALTLSPFGADDAGLTAALRRVTANAPGTAGVSVVHVESGASAALNPAMRFPMMSVYKLPIAIHVLREVDRGRLDLAERVTLSDPDRRPGASPIGEAIAAGGPQVMTLRDIVVAVVTRSDNTASDWLLARAGGPRAVAATLAALQLSGIDVSRYELEFSADYNGLCCIARMQPFSLEKYAAAVDALPRAVRERAARAYERDRRDTATPAGFTRLLSRLQKGELLSVTSTAWLLELMAQMHARDGRIRAGLPPDTQAALRPGTSGLTAGVRAAHNDTGIITLPGGRGHLAIAVFLNGAGGTEEARDQAIARFARAAYDWGISRN
jgi:beta-lactamase class A